MNKTFVLLLFILLFSSSVLALGVTPGRTTLNYEPGVTKSVDVSIVNSEQKNLQLVVLVQGDLNGSIAVSDVSFSMSKDQRERKLSYKITMPSKLSPGQHTGEIVIVQLPEKSGTSEAFVGASVAVATQVYVFVPYPGKYAEAELNVIGGGQNETTFAIPVTSRGDLDLVRVRGVIDIYGPTNEKITSLSTNEISLKTSERKELVAQWKPTVGPGIYRAVATVIYDDQTLKVEKQFAIGTKTLDLQNVEVNDFTLGGIAKFDLLVENKWSDTISGAYAQMQVYNSNGDVIADFKSAGYDVPPLTKKIISAFWDTDGVKKGTYKSSVFLRYGDQSEQKDLQLEVSDNAINVVGLGYVISQAGSSSGGSNTLVVVLVTAIVVLVLINIIWFLVLRKRLARK